MRLFLIRHGETSWNKEEVFRGRIDVGLNEYGLEQARLTAMALQGLAVAAVYTSPLCRAYETARQIAGPHGLSMLVEPGLTDLDYGAWQGQSLLQVKERHPDAYRLWTEAPHQVCFEGGESLDDVRDRVLNWYRLLTGRHQGQNVVAVSHRVVNKVLLCALLGLDNSHFWSLRQDTCAINVVEENGQYGHVICRLNDTSHVRRRGEAFPASKQAADF